MAATLYVYNKTPLPQLDLTAIAMTARKILELLAYYSWMRSSSPPNHLLNKILTKIITFIHTIEASLLAAQIGYQLATDAMTLSGTEDESQEFHESLQSIQELSGKGQEIAKSVMDNFREIEQQIYKIAESTKDNTFIVVIPPNPTHTDTRKIPAKEIGSALVAKLNLFTEFSRSVEATAKWWNHVKADLKSPNPTLLPLERGSSDASEIFSKWAEMQQEFQQYHNVVNSANGRFPELLVSSRID